MPDTLTAIELLERLSIPNSAIREASRRWAGTSEELENGLESKHGAAKRGGKHRFEKLRDRYISIARYCEDAQRLISFHSLADKSQSPDDLTQQSEILAIDPHLLHGYSDPWDLTNFTAFYYFPKQGELDLQLPMFTYSSLFHKKPMILDAGRTELSEMLSYFLKKAEGGGGGAPDGDELNLPKFFKDLEEEFGQESDSIVDASEAFKRLMLAGGKPQLKQQLALARLVGVMKRDTFLPPELAISSALDGEENDEHRLKISAYLRFVRNNPAILNDIRSSFSAAYREFRHKSELPSAVTTETDFNSPLRIGEMYDLDAIMEVHVLNTCLQIAEIPVQVNYVTLSSRMYGFIRQFDRSVVRVPLLHPRSASMFHNSKIFDLHKEEMARVVAGAIAFGGSIPENGAITEEKIENFQTEYTSSMESTGNTFTHALADAKDERDFMINSIAMLVKEGSREEAIWKRVEGSFHNKLERQVTDTGALYSKNSQSLAEDGWSAYRDFATEGSRGQQPSVLVRRFSDPENDVNRLAILPVGGAYRYLFTIHNSKVMAAFEQVPTDSFQSMPLKEILSKIETALDSKGPDSNQTQKNEAIMYFVRAVFAASHGQWALAESLATQADEKLILEEDTGLERLEEAFLARVKQCKVEVLFLRHMCRRALSYSNGPGPRRNQWLKKSAKDLCESAALTCTIDPKFSGVKTKIDPTSVRQALAAFGLQIEWLTKQEGQMESEPLDCLPSGEQKPLFVWTGLNLSGSGVVQNRAGFRMAGQRVLEQVQEAYYSVVAGGAEEHSKENWRYLLLRAHTMLLTLDACVDTGLDWKKYGDPPDDLKFETKLQAISDLWAEHEVWERSCPAIKLDAEPAIKLDAEEGKTSEAKEGGAAADDSGPVSPRSKNPFAAALLAAARVRLNVLEDRTDVENSVWKVSDPAAFLRDFSSMDTYCNELNAFGFPRKVIRAVKKKYAKALINQLELEYSEPDFAAAKIFGEIEM